MDIVPQLVVNSLIAGSLYALIAMGFSLIYGVTRFFNLTHGIYAVTAAYAVFYLTKTLEVNVWIAIPVGIVAAAALGLLLEICIYKPLRTRKASGLVLLVASLGAFTAIQAVIAMLFTSQFKTFSGLFENGVVQIGSAAVTYVQIALFACSVVAVALLWFLLSRTLFGRAVRAIADDEEVAKIVGIDTDRAIRWVVLIGAALAGVAGVLAGFDIGINPTMGLPLLLKGIIAAVVGGMGNVYGALLGAFLLGFAENFGIWHISGEWKDAIAFVVLILFMLFRPQGILGKKL